MPTETEPDFQQQVQQIEALLVEIQATPDTGIRNKSLALIQALMDFHSAGINRMMEVISESGSTSSTTFGKFANDDLVSSLLLLYGLHPDELNERVEKALNKVRPYIRSQGGSVDLAQLNDGAITLVLDYHQQGNTSSTAILKKAVEDAVYELAPDATDIQIEELNRPSFLAFVPLESLRRAPASNHLPATAAK